MRKLCFILLITTLLPCLVKGSHITGGEMLYTFSGVNLGLYRYNFTLKLYQRCNSGRQFPNPIVVSVFDKSSGLRVMDISVNLSAEDNIRISDPDPCISNPPDVCYDVAYYNFPVSLPSSVSGYVLASQVNYRINGINNLQPGYSSIGALYTAEIPGTSGLPSAPENNSAIFTGSDLVIVCANNAFNYSFAAFDQDGDQLRYSFCSAYASTSGNNGGGFGVGGNTLPPEPPPFPQVPYNTPSFSPNQPLGSSIQINPNTGLLTGIAPEVGIYVVTVCVQEVRGGRVIATQRKDIQINVADCDVASASLEPEYLLCRNTQTISLANQSSSPLIVSTDWEFYNETNNLIYTTNTPLVTYTFATVGVYKVKLVINRNQTCSDSITSTIRVFPGFRPDFRITGICYGNPSFFTDQTTSVYGVPDSWQWDFGEPSTFTDISTIRNPDYTYPLMGTKEIRLIVTDTKGCRDTVTKSVVISDKPPVSLAFRDTLICRNDPLVLQANGLGVFTWTPNVAIVNPNTATPTVTPLTTTRYYVTMEEGGCTNRDSVLVRVVNFVSLQMMNDTTICSGDTTRLNIVSDGLLYQWPPAGQLIDPQVQQPFAITTTTTTYQVTARIGSCSATGQIVVRPVPYPVVSAGTDINICYNASALLNGTTNASSWAWSPPARLSSPALLNPLASPSQTTDYILTVTDNRGCPKPVQDTVRVSVEPPIRLQVTSDTAVVVGQSLQLNVSGAESYLWSPADNLSSPVIADPVAGFTAETSGFRYKVVGTSTTGCNDSAYVTIKVFKTGPAVFVPSGFTPNNDGLNDLLYPIAVGMRSIDYFNVYNRWGQLVFSTRRNGHGWDGRINGQLQTSSTYVWMVKAVDYNGNSYFQKGISTLIR
ncbi:MAG TPA: gliding motility-associated C-terminal domain-containing protein [Chitinophagaceae bacterium]|nr:gliding motility-associated C-terminal domain-containing protein [Chitinophagaceae bacterium]